MDKSATKVLVADDDNSIRELVNDCLSSHFDVILASDGQEAYELAVSEHPDIAIIDLRMPVLDGYGVVRKLRTNPETEKIPVVIFTASIQGLVDSKYKLQESADGFLAKPFSTRELRKKIAGIVEGKKGH